MIMSDKSTTPNQIVSCQLEQYRQSSARERQSHYELTRNNLELKLRLQEISIPVRDYKIDIAHFKNWLSEFSELLSSYENSCPEAVIEKCLEHYLAFLLLPITQGCVYIDVASAGSIWVDLLIKRNHAAYRLDKIFKLGIHGNTIGADVRDMQIADNFADCMSLQCAFETFADDADIGFINEAKRVIRPNGSFIILPLYLDETFINISSPYCDLTNVPLDDGAIRVWREDKWQEPFSRHYSPEVFFERIFKKISSLSGEVIYISNLDEVASHFAGQKIYCNFVFRAQK